MSGAPKRAFGAEWTTRDDRAAAREGWCISYFSNGWQLQKIDCPEPNLGHPTGMHDEGAVFESDEHAWLWVVLNPTPLHLRAGAFLLEHAPDEHAAIMRHVLGIMA
jgi:hypothetical protein